MWPLSHPAKTEAKVEQGGVEPFHPFVLPAMVVVLKYACASSKLRGAVVEYFQYSGAAFNLTTIHLALALHLTNQQQQHRCHALPAFFA